MEALDLFGLGWIGLILGLFFLWTEIPYFSAQRVGKVIDNAASASVAKLK